jgi:hypothetical protein
MAVWVRQRVTARPLPSLQRAALAGMMERRRLPLRSPPDRFAPLSLSSTKSLGIYNTDTHMGAGQLLMLIRGAQEAARGFTATTAAEEEVVPARVEMEQVDVQDYPPTESNARHDPGYPRPRGPRHP